MSLPQDSGEAGREGPTVSPAAAGAVVETAVAVSSFASPAPSPPLPPARSLPNGQPPMAPSERASGGVAAATRTAGTPPLQRNDWPFLAFPDPFTTKVTTAV